MSSALLAALSERFGGLCAQRSVAGGDAHQAWRVELETGEIVFVKHGGAGTSEVFMSEAEGLASLAAAAGGLIRIPCVLAVLRQPPALCLEWIAEGRVSPESEEALGRGLAAIHRAAAGPSFGRHARHFLAGLPFEARTDASWPRYFGEAMLTVLAAHCGARGADDDGAIRRGVARVLLRLDSLLPSPPPSLLHGDLWAGNALVDAEGMPVLVDPFAYVGHAEVDLAMMHFFGGFQPRTFAAYDESIPPQPGRAERRPLYELIPLLSHTALFGGSYRARALAVLGRFR